MNLSMNSNNPTPVAAFNFLTQAALLQHQQTYLQNNLLRQSLPPGYFISGNVNSHNLPGPPVSLKLPLSLPVPPPLSLGNRNNHVHSNQNHNERHGHEFKQHQHENLNFNPLLSLMYTHDYVVGDFMETRLENKPIYAFSVGGEKRLCLPQVLNNVLFPHTTLQEINQVCENLHIFCKRCNTQQMRILKERNVFGPNLENCGLITKSDAERLCKVLLHRNLPKYNKPVSSEDGICVYHHCFGKQRAFLIPQLYTAPDAACLVCDNCSSLLSPTQFVGHAHNRPEKRTCHWGFDTAHWRNYIMLEHDANRCDSEKYQLEKVLQQFKIKFDRKRQEILNNAHEENAKRARREGDEESSPTSKIIPPPPAIITSGSANCPMPQNLRQGSSVLLNPERVMSEKDANACDSVYVPNVRLAPLPRKKQSVQDEPLDMKKVNNESATASSAAGTFSKEWDELITCLNNNIESEEEVDRCHSVVQKLREGYAQHIKKLKLDLEHHVDADNRRRQLEAELERSRRQIEEQQTPDVRKMKMKYSAQKEEIRLLEEERDMLLSQLVRLSGDKSASPSLVGSPEHVEPSQPLRQEEDGPPALEPCGS